MSILKQLFGSGQEGQGLQLNWIPLTELEALDTLLKSKRPVLVFKHSTRCGISRFALRNFESYMVEKRETIDFVFLDILNYRSISNALAQRFDVRHESPQLLIFDNGKLTAHFSHGGINEGQITNALKV